MPHNKGRQPFSSATRPIEGGRLAVPMQTMQAHIQGNFGNHAAVDVTMHDPIPFLGSEPNVQLTLERIAAILECSGSGFVSISDRYGPCPGAITVGDPGIPDFATAFNLALMNDRLQNGGVILIKAVTYIISSTVTVPAGITVVGELAGTILVCESSEQPLFHISKGVDRPTINNDLSLPIVSTEPTDIVKFFNLTIADNLNGAILGGGQPIPTLMTVPMIECERGSAFYCEQVTFLGRLGTLGAGPVFGRDKSLRAIGYTTGSTDASTLVVENCVFDGFRTVLDFSPVNSSSQLVINKCKARVFGTDALATSTVRSSNCFATINIGNARLTNNFMVAGGLYVNTFYFVSSIDANLTIIGNTGSASFPGAVPDKLVSDGGSGLTFNSIISGNNWANKNIQNEWFITIGDGTTSIGDITGPGSLDRAIFYSQNTNMQATVIVNRGTYDITGTSTNLTDINLIGNKSGGSIPHIRLNLSNVTTDYVGNRFVGFRSLRHVRFSTLGATYQSVHVDPGENIAEVGDCRFTDVALIIRPITNASFPSIVSIKGCRFNQTGSFVDNICLLAPAANMVEINDCKFTGNGYIGAIGNFGGYSSVAQTTPNIILDNVTMDLTGSTISSSFPASLTSDRYFTISSSTGKVSFKNCQIYASNTLTSVTPINVGLATTFTRFVSILAKEIYIENSTFNGPQQTFDVGLSTFAMPTLFVEPGQSFVFENSRIIVGALPLQISGPSAFSSGVLRSGLTIKDSEFVGSAGLTMTLLDIDVELTSFSLGTTIVPELFIENNIFHNRTLGGAPFLVQHINNTGVYYDKTGIVSIYAGQWQAHFSGNKVFGTIREIPTSSLTTYSGIVINIYDTTTTPALTGVLANKIIVSDNIIEITNDHGGTFNVSCLINIAPMIGIYNNIMHMINPLPGDVGGFEGCLKVFNSPPVGGGQTEGIIQGNVFSRRNVLGAIVGSLAFGYVHIVFSNTPGILVDNIFSDPTIDGTITTVVLDMTTPGWLIERNKIQTVTTTIRGTSGMHGSSEVGTEYGVHGITAAIDTPTKTSIAVQNSSAWSTRWSLDADGISEERFYAWFLPLDDVLPIGVFIDEVLVVATSITFSVNADVVVAIEDNTNINTVSVDVTTAGTYAISPTITNTFRVIPGNNTTVKILGTLEDATASVTTIKLKTVIQYHW